jgi:hypothetical protein
MQPKKFPVAQYSCMPCEFRLPFPQFHFQSVNDASSISRLAALAFRLHISVTIPFHTRSFGGRKKSQWPSAVGYVKNSGNVVKLNVAMRQLSLTLL